MGLLTRVAAAFRPAGPAAPRGEPGRRAYAIGDIHGRLDLLDRLLDAIAADIAAHPDAVPLIVFLGDYVDRGPDSAGVIARLIDYAPPGGDAVFLIGNHEEALLGALDGEAGVLRAWLGFGGDACAASYGIDPNMLDAASDGEAGALLGRAIPDAHVRFLDALRDSWRFGDYLFVHAGIRPGLALDRQEPRDMRWIREPFLGHRRAHGAVIVHGHSIVAAPDDRGNRIAIDTGAYASGILTALVIEESGHRFLATAPPA